MEEPALSGRFLFYLADLIVASGWGGLGIFIWFVFIGLGELGLDKKTWKGGTCHLFPAK
jgi:hypothetical protein